ncbi:hypothetical protein KA005_32110, partial [bacterium]|nr:hypothetical protein [bacterium]
MVNKYTKENKNEFVVLPEPTMQGLFAEIVQIISQIHPKKYPSQLPANSHEAGNKFIGLISFKQGMFERTRMNEDGNLWLWPFKTRILMLLDKYIHIDDLLRDTIDSAKLMGVDWRGDDFNGLVDVMNEHEIMNKTGVKEYRKE